jgi:hypothetical protein
MTVTEKKETIARIKKIVGAKGNMLGIHFTYAELSGPFLTISHMAGAHDKTMKIVNERLMEMGLPTVEELKEMFEIIKESGDPETSYTLKVRMKAIDRNKITQLRGRKMSNIPNHITY